MKQFKIILLTFTLVTYFDSNQVLDMISIRNFVRAAPRSVPQLLSRSSPRLFSNVRGTSLLQRSRIPSPKPRCAAFSTSQAVWEKEGQSSYALDRPDLRRLTLGVVDQELSAKIESELEMEKDIRDSEQYPANVQEYLDNSPFEACSHYRHPMRNTNCSSYMIHQVKKKSS